MDLVVADDLDGLTLTRGFRVSCEIEARDGPATLDATVFLVLISDRHVHHKGVEANVDSLRSYKPQPPSTTITWPLT